MTNAKKGIIIGIIALISGLLVFTGCSSNEEPKAETKEGEIAVTEEVAVTSEEAPKGEDPVEPGKNGVKITPEEYRYTKQIEEKKTEDSEAEGVLTEIAETVTETATTVASNQSNSNKPGGSPTNSSSSNTNNTSSNSSSGGSNGTASSGSSSNTATSQGGSNSSPATNSGDSNAGSSGTSNSSSGNSSSSSSNSGTASGSSGSNSPVPSQPAPHAHIWDYSLNNTTGVVTRTCSCGASDSRQATWVVDVPAQEEVWGEEPVYVTLKLVTVYNGPNSVVYESYSMEEAQYWMNTHPAEWGNYIITYPSVIDHYEKVLYKPAREEVGHWEYYYW